MTCTDCVLFEVCSTCAQADTSTKGTRAMRVLVAIEKRNTLCELFPSEIMEVLL